MKMKPRYFDIPFRLNGHLELQIFNLSKECFQTNAKLIDIAIHLLLII